MKNLKQFIIEKFRLSRDCLSQKQRDLSNVDFSYINNMIYYKSPSEENSHYMKMDQYFNKKSNPQRLVNSIKDNRKLMIRWYICVSRGYSDYYPTFKDAIIERTKFTEDQLDAYILSRYKRYKDFEKLKANFEAYLDEYNVKYDKN